MKEDDIKLSEVLSKEGELIEKYTLKLYIFDGTHDPNPLASSVLVKSYKNFYLLTAAHVYLNNQFSHVYFIREGKTSQTIGGQMLYTNIHSSETAKNTDISIIKLLPDMVQSLTAEGKMFYDINTSSNIEIESDDLPYLLYGYPNSKTKINKKTKRIKRIKKIAFSYLTRKSPIILDSYSLNQTIQIILIINKVYNLKQSNLNRGPKLTGMSGCGLWSFHKTEKNSIGLPKLILEGIFIEHIFDRSIGIVTKSNVIFNKLHEYFEEGK